MKRLLTMLLAGVMVLGCVACGGGKPKVEVADANELLTKVWDTYAEDEKFFAMGGHFEAPVENAPGTYDVSKVEDLLVSFCIPSDAVAMVDDAATITHAMNANNFSAAAYHVTDAKNAQTIIDGIKEQTLNNQWICGFPEKLIIVTVGEDYLVSAFGAADIVDNFEAKLAEVYGEAVNVAVEEKLAE